MSSHSHPEFLRALNREQKRLAIGSWPYLLGYLLLTAGPFIYVDLYHWDETLYYAWTGMLSWALGYLLLLAIMNEGGYFAGGKASGIGTYFALGVITGLAIGLALVVLILPGLYLLMRWLPLFARALTSQEWATQSMGWSWRATEHLQKPLGLALLGPVLLYGVSIAIAYLYDTGIASYEVVTVIVNVASNVASAWLTLLGVASFGLLTEAERPHGDLRPTDRPA